MDYIETALNRIRTASEMSLSVFGKPLLVAYSGGKDSDVALDLVGRAGVPYEVEHALTTVDAPETVYHVQDTFKRLELASTPCRIHHGTYKGIQVSMWTLIPMKRMPPTRIVRYCCSTLKETSGAGRMVVTGVRWAESARRQNRGIYEKIASRKHNRIMLMSDNDDVRRVVDSCRINSKMSVNPIIDWSDEQVWAYIRDNHIAYNPLYDEGCHRVGCIGCPMSNMREREFEQYPTYKNSYIHAFDRMVSQRIADGLETDWKDGQEVFDWWLSK